MIPMCWKCSETVLEPASDADDGFVMAGCKLETAISDYDDARRYCPLLKEKEEELGNSDATGEDGS